MNAALTQVGAPDPELKNSPIIDEFQEEVEEGSRELELAEGECYFNGATYPIGTSVQSGSELLRCSGGGVWIRQGEREGPSS